MVSEKPAGLKNGHSKEKDIVVVIFPILQMYIWECFSGNYVYRLGLRDLLGNIWSRGKKYGMISGTVGEQLLDSYRFNLDSAAILAFNHRPTYESTSAANLY